jgi:phytanoyl-CoA hydroxylase
MRPRDYVSRAFARFARWAPAEATAPSTQPTFLSKPGGLWIDRPDWLDTLARKTWTGAFSEELAGRIFRFVRDGYVVIEQAVPAALADRLDRQIAEFWTAPPAGMLIETFRPDGRLKLIPPVLDLREGSKLLDTYVFSGAAREAVANPPVMEFLRAIFDARPKAFQGLSFWYGSQQDIHKDTAYVKVDSGAMRLAATWLALEDVEAGTGELEYYVGSHRAPHFMFAGESKWMEHRPDEHSAFLRSLHDDAARFDYPRSSFLGKKGDVLIWHGDLAHGGARITKPGRTRRSLVTHFTSELDQPYYRRTAQTKELVTDSCVFASGYVDVIPS